MPGLRAIVLLRVGRRAPWSRIDIARFIAVTCMRQGSGTPSRTVVLQLFTLAALAPLSPPNLLAQQAAITGRVTDVETGATLSGATVEVLGVQSGAVATNASGAFQVTVPAGRRLSALRDAAGRPAGPGGRAEDRRPQPPGRRQHFAAGRARLPPAEGHNLRLTWNQAFATPGTSALFLDIPTGMIPIAPGVGYTLRAVGVPAGGLTFADRCQGGLMGHCMRSPFMPGQLPAIAALFWDALIAQFAPETLRPFLLGPGSQPGDPALGTVFGRLNTDALGPAGGEVFPLDQGSPRPARAGTDGVQQHRSGVQGTDPGPRAAGRRPVFRQRRELHRPLEGGVPQRLPRPRLYGCVPRDPARAAGPGGPGDVRTDRRACSGACRGAGRCSHSGPVRLARSGWRW